MDSCPIEGFDTRPRKREPRLRDAALYYGMTNATRSRTSGHSCCWEHWEALKRRAVRRITFGVPVPLLSKIASIPQIGVRGISSPHLGRYQSDDTIRTNLPKGFLTEQKGLTRQRIKSIFSPESRKRKTSRGPV